MNFDDLMTSITPEIFQNLQRAVETGRWPDGRRLTDEQREHCMAAVIAYGQRNLPVHEQVGYIDRGVKAEGEVCGDEGHHPEEADQAIRFVNGKGPITH